MAEEKEKTKQKKRYFVTAVHGSDCGCTDDEDSVIKLEFQIPGAKKDKIHLHVVEGGLRLVAPKNDDEEYVSHYHFACPADVAATEAKYEDGILKVDIPYDCPNPYKDVPPVKIA